MLAWMFAVSSNVQDASSPPPEMQKLKVLEGTWDATIKAGPADSKGVAIYKIDLGGMWLTMTGEEPGHDGKPTKLRIATEFKSKDQLEWTMYGPGSDGKEEGNE